MIRYEAVVLDRGPLARDLPFPQPKALWWLESFVVWRLFPTASCCWRGPVRTPPGKCRSSIAVRPNSISSFRSHTPVDSAYASAKRGSYFNSVSGGTYRDALRVYYTNEEVRYSGVQP